MSLDYVAWRFWWDLVQTGATLAVGAYVWFVNRDRVTHSRITVLEQTVDKRLDGAEARLAKVEADCGHLPKHGDLARVYDRINGVAGKVGDVGSAVSELGGEMRAMRRSIDLINQHLINRREG